jgi:hypothetical protein
VSGLLLLPIFSKKSSEKYTDSLYNYVLFLSLAGCHSPKQKIDESSHSAFLVSVTVVNIMEKENNQLEI